MTDAASAPGSAAASAQKTVGRLSLLSLLESFTVPVALILCVGIFSVLLPGTFPTLTNARAILGTQAVTAMLALAIMVPLAAGEFDLSLASLVGWASMEFAVFVAHDHLSIGAAAVAVAASGALIGAVNAFVVLRLGVSSFIATLAMGTVLSGLSLWITNGSVVYNGIPTAVSNVGQELFFRLPATFWIVAIVGLVMWTVFRHFPVGRQVYATGGNRIAARLAGVRTTRLVTGTFVAGGALAAVAGMMSVAYSGSASPVTGPPLLLPAFAAVFLGSTTVEVGRYNVFGTLLGVLLVAVGVAGLEQLGLASYVEPVFNGGILVVAVAASVGVGRFKERRKAAEVKLVDASLHDSDTGEPFPPVPPQISAATESTVDR